MNLLTIYIACIITVALAWLGGSRLYRIYRRRRREALYKKPFPQAWQTILHDNFALYRTLPTALRERLHARIHYFLASKEFVGRGGIVIDDTIRISVAGQACLLVLADDGDIYPDFKTILIYPDTFHSETTRLENGLATSKRSHRAGESWHRGPIILSWGDVVRGGLDDSDGHNVVIHEFAHKLDEQNKAVNGQPLLREHAHYAEWVKVMNEEYQAFLKRVEKRDNKIIDAYGAESPPEFFAVASESFFEKPEAMQERLPHLYEQLQRVYQLDPASW